MVDVVEVLIPGVAIPGPGGDDAYKVAVKNGFTGTVEEWLASLNGAPGRVTDVEPGDGVEIDVSDPAKPVISLSASTTEKIEKADTAVQPGDLGLLATKNAVTVDDIAASGTPAGTKFLSGDGNWATPTADLAAPRVATLDNIAVPGLPENTPYLDLFAPEPVAMRTGLRGPNHMVGTVNQTVIFEFANWAAWSDQHTLPQASYPSTNYYTQHLNAILHTTPWGHAKPIFDIGGPFDGNGIRYFRYKGSQPIIATITGTLTILIKSHLAASLEESRIGTVNLWLRNPGSTNNIGENQSYFRLAQLPGAVARGMNLTLTDTTDFPDQAVANVVTIPVMYNVFLQPGYSYEFVVSVSDWDGAAGAQLRNREKVRVIGGGLMMNLPIPLE
jgi:hypothetical protein